MNEHVEYLTEYFRELNVRAREMTSGDQITKALILAHRLKDDLGQGLHIDSQSVALMQEL